MKKQVLTLILVLAVVLPLFALPASAASIPKVSISAVSQSNQKITLKWAKASGVDGYRIYYTDKKDVSTFKTLKTVEGGSKTSYTTAKTLTAGKTYYFRVAAYKKVDGKIKTGAKSAIKSVKIVKKEAVTSTKAGDIIKFGKYDWRVLEVKDGKALILSDKIIEHREYHSEYVAITWENCDLRKYLNGEFYQNFSAAEQKKIAETTVVNKDNQWFGTPGGNSTKDKVFLLSLEEVVKYFGDSGQLKNRPSDDIYFISDKFNDSRVAYNMNNEASIWRLRSPGSYNKIAALVSYFGVIGDINNFIGVDDYLGVRPAMWITL